LNFLFIVVLLLLYVFLLELSIFAMWPLIFYLIHIPCLTGYKVARFLEIIIFEIMNVAFSIGSCHNFCWNLSFRYLISASKVKMMLLFNGKRN
jgi:hypothetical protein